MNKKTWSSVMVPVSKEDGEKILDGKKPLLFFGICPISTYGQRLFYMSPEKTDAKR